MQVSLPTIFILMSFLSVHLHRELISDALETFHQGAEVVHHLKRADVEVYKLKENGKQIAELNIYHKNDGRSTLSPNMIGDLKEISTKWAQHVHDCCKIENATKKTISLKDIGEEKLSLLIEYLNEENLKVVKSEIQFGQHFTIESLFGDKSYINYFPTKGSLVIQGSDSYSKACIIEGIAIFLEYKEVIDLQLKEIEVDLTVDSVLKEVEQYIPHSKEYLGESLIAILSPSIALRHLNIRLTDYSLFVFPALRCLEGYLKKYFSSINHPIPPGGFSVVFNGNKMIQQVKDEIQNDEICENLEQVYSFYKNNRHGLFHADEDPDTTRIIDNIETAISLIEETFELLEGSYQIISK